MLRLLPSSLTSKSGSIPRQRPASASTSDLLNPPVELYIHIPNHGAVFMTLPDSSINISGTPNDGSGDPDRIDPDGTRPRSDYVMTGELEVFLPSQSSFKGEDESGKSDLILGNDPTNQVESQMSHLSLNNAQGGPIRNRKRCRAIRVGLKSEIRLDLGPGRMGEEDELFHRKVEIIGSNSDGIWLEEGSQRFEFTLVLPSSLAPHDWHTNGSISIILYAELEGLPTPSAPALEHRLTSNSNSRRPASPSPGLFGFGSRSQSRNRSGQASPTTPAARSRSSSPAPSTLVNTGHGFNPGLVSSSFSMSITRQEAPPLPATPSYDESQAAASAATANSSTTSLTGRDSDAKGKGKGSDHDSLDSYPSSMPLVLGGADHDESWIKGTIRTTRTVYPIYNPNPSGGVTQLDDLRNGVAEGLGEWSVRMVSDVWTICALLNVQFNLTLPSPLLTLFSLRVILSQTHSIISPRDDPTTTRPLINTRQFIVIEHGKRPPKSHLHPGKSVEALWRGVEAGGEDQGGWKWEGKGRLPNDDVARPTTFKGIITPIKVSHALILEVFFSVWGEDEHGNTMRTPGPGGLRLLRSSRPVELPSCAFIPVNVNLPSYENTQSFSPLSTDAKNSVPAVTPCPKCHLLPSQRTCTTCPPSAIPHARHDLPAQLVGNRSGVCPLCSKDVVPGGTPSWRNCACGAKIEEMELRMKRFVIAEEEARSGSGMRSGGREGVGSEKIWADRGRVR